jgi:hypothetical protein
MPQTIEHRLDEVGFVGSKEKFGGGRRTDEFWLTFTDFSDGWKAVLSGVRPNGKNGIELDFSFQVSAIVRPSREYPAKPTYVARISNFWPKAVG